MTTPGDVEPGDLTLEPRVVAGLRDRLNTVDYTVGGVQRFLGPVAHAALSRNETVPGLRRCGAEEPNGGTTAALGTLIRLFLLQDPVPRPVLDAALPGLVEPLVDAGVVRVVNGDPDLVAAGLDIRPYGAESADADRDLWIVADPTPGMDGGRPVVGADHVLGVNSAATTLAQLTVRRSVGRALDLGTGCGVQATHLVEHAAEVVGTDVNPRALAAASLTAALNGVDVDLRFGSLFEPVAGERFDLIVSNPPFVISPSGDLMYRESGLPGDELCQRLLRAVPDHLTLGGIGQFLVDWIEPAGEDWRERIRGWVDGTGCDAWIIRRESVDPSAYVETWLKDAGLHGTAEYRDRYHRWLDWLERQAVETLGFGWVVLRRPVAGGDPVVRIEDWRHPVRQPLGSVIGRWLDVIEELRGLAPSDLLDRRLIVADDVHFEQIVPPGAADPAHIVLRQRDGLGRQRPVDTATAGFVGACDGDLTVRQIADALAELLPPEVAGEQAALRDRLAATSWDLIVEGYLTASS